jgi:hypothetical protein
VTGKSSSHILYIAKIGLTDDGVYLCKSVNEKDLLTEIGFKVHVNEHDRKVSVFLLNETILPEDIQPTKSNLVEVKEQQGIKPLPNIKIIFSDKAALARGERVEIICKTDSNATLEWYRVDKNGELGEFLTNTNSLIRQPVTDEDLGRYRCIASNQNGSRSRDTYLSKPNGIIEFLVYGFVDKHSDSWLEQNGIGANKFDSNFSIAKIEENAPPNILRVEDLNQKVGLRVGENLRFECINGIIFILINKYFEEIFFKYIFFIRN